MYDIIIVGAGVNGCFIARTLAKYKLNILVIEKESDVGDGTSAANSAIVHSGYDPHTGTLKAELNVLGNKMYPEICKELDVSFKMNGSLTISTNEEEDKKLDELLALGKANGAEVRIVDRDELLKMEPFVTKKALRALYAPTAGIINPFELCVALMENAMDNGVSLHLNEKVLKVEKKDDFLVKTDKGEYSAKVVINCAGLYGDDVSNSLLDEKIKLVPRKGEYYLLDHFNEPYVTHTLFSVPSSKGKGVLVAPTTSGNYLVGPSSNFIDDKDDVSTNNEILTDVVKEAYRIVDNIPMQYVITEFAGLRAYHESNDFVINEKLKGFINVIGMQSPGLASAPATASKVASMVARDIELVERSDFNPIRRPYIRLKYKSNEEKNKMIKENPLFGKIICRCEEVSEGEIIDAIHRNCGATTVKGLKKRLRTGFGKCQGGFCQSLILKILARELNKDMKDITLKGEASYILLKETKGE